MSSRTSASRYARALLDIAGAPAEAQNAERDLAGFVDTLAAYRDLRQALTSPSVPASAKRGIVTTLATRLGMTGPTTKLLQLMAERDRLGLAEDLLAAYRQRLLERQQIVRAEIASAVPLGDEALKAITGKLSAATGKQVAVNASVDPTLIGGVVATVGSTVYDGSVKSQLDRLRKQLVGAGS